MKIIGQSLIFIMILGIFAVANVPPPPPYESKGIELQQDYPDYVFYFGKYYVFDENGKSIKKLDLDKIELTTTNPFVIKESKDFNLQYFNEKKLNAGQVKFSAREDYLIAVKKEVNDQVKTKLSQKLIDLIDLKQNGEGIYYAALPEIGLINKPNDINYGLYRMRMVVSHLDDKGLEFQNVRFQEGDNHYIENPKEKENNFLTTTVLVGVILIFSAFIMAIGIFIFKRSRKIA